MKKLFNKFLTFLGLKKKEIKDAQTEVLVNLITNGRAEGFNPEPSVPVDAVPNQITLAEKIFSEEANKATEDFMRDRAEDIKKLSQKVDAVLAPDEPISSEVKNQIFVFDEKAKVFKTLPKKVQEKALANVTQKVDKAVETYKKTKNVDIELSGGTLVTNKPKTNRKKKTPKKANK